MGKPKEGNQLGRLCPVIFKPNYYHRTATEVSETLTPEEAAHGAFRLKGIITKVNSNGSGGELLVLRRDDKEGPYDKKPTRFFRHSFENPRQKIPKWAPAFFLKPTTPGGRT